LWSRVTQVNSHAYQSISALATLLFTSVISSSRTTVNLHTLATHHVTYSYVLSSAAPIQDGAISGYFEDMLTHSLLGLTVYNRLLHSGTYGPEEPGHASTKLALLVDGDYDWLFLPFIPHNRNFYRPLVMHERNKRWLMKCNTLKSLRSAFDSALCNAQRVASQIQLPLPSYACVLAPKILYEGKEEDPLFPHQFHPFFTPSATHTRWVRIHRVILLLLGFTNLCC
jgi:hypothetical protein